MTRRYPPIEPYDQGMLDTGDGNLVYWEACGNPDGKPNQYTNHPPAHLLAFVRICTHYFANGAWLDEGALLRDAGRLAGIPGVLIHGQLDMGSPLRTAWELAREWPDARLVVVDDSGHTGSDSMSEQIIGTLDRFAAA
jgi:proline iminopeptidase